MTNLRGARAESAVQIPVRRLDFAFDARAVPRDWYAEDLYLTHVFQALSVAFPEGEKFFVESVRLFRDQIHDPALKAAVAGFAGQEAMHGRGHRAFNEIIDADGGELSQRLEGDPPPRYRPKIAEESAARDHLRARALHSDPR